MGRKTNEVTMEYLKQIGQRINRVSNIREFANIMGFYYSELSSALRKERNFSPQRWQAVEEKIKELEKKL